MSKTPEERLAIVETRAEAMEKTLVRIEGKQDQLIEQANRWKGAFVVVLALGGLLGWIGDHAVKLLTRGG